MTKNDHFETQKCHFWAFLASFEISFSSLQHPTYIPEVRFHAGFPTNNYMSGRYGRFWVTHIISAPNPKTERLNKLNNVCSQVLRARSSECSFIACNFLTFGNSSYCYDFVPDLMTHSGLYYFPIIEFYSDHFRSRRVLSGYRRKTSRSSITDGREIFMVAT